MSEKKTINVLGVEREIPKSGEIWHHFKGNDYQILSVGKVVYGNWQHRDPGSLLCQLLLRIGIKNNEAKDYRIENAWLVWYMRDKVIYNRSLDDFMDIAPTHKYPDAKQKYRFEKVEKDD